MPQGRTGTGGKWQHLSVGRYYVTYARIPINHRERYVLLPSVKLRKEGGSKRSTRVYENKKEPEKKWFKVMGYAGMNPKESFMKRGTGPLERMAMFTSIITVVVTRGEEKPRG